jgi:hypothetical protein
MRKQKRGKRSVEGEKLKDEEWRMEKNGKRMGSNRWILI